MEDTDTQWIKTSLFKEDEIFTRVREEVVNKTINRIKSDITKENKISFKNRRIKKSENNV